MNQPLQKILDFILQSEHLSAEEKTGLLKSVKDVDKELEITAFKLNRTEKVKRTTAILLEETIEELEQKRKAVEAQNRELEIETGLEKVRTIALSMKEPADMPQVCRIIAMELDKLGVKEIRNVQTAIFYESKGTYMNYEYYFKHNKPIITETSYTNHKIHQAFADQMLKGKGEFFATHINQAELAGWIVYQKTTNVFIDTFLESANSLNYYWDSLGPVALGISTYLPLNKNEIDLFKRFRNVFELAYRRFLDIEKAEAQAREAEVELALERVRSQAMAMQKSSDLLDIVVIMRNEFTRLGYEAQYFWHMMWLPDKYEKAMTSGDGTKIGFVMELPRHIHGNIPLLAKWEKSKEQTVVYAMDVEEALDYVDKMISLGDFQNIDPQAPSHDDIRHIGGLTFIMARTTHGEIGYSLPGVVENPPKEDLDILVRFAGAFDIAHRRFLDLKKSEAQAREVQIELALEKVRSRSLGMHKSDELNEVVSIIFEKLKELQIPATAVGISIYIDGSKDLNAFVCGENEAGFVITNYRLPYFHHKISEDFNNVREKQLDFFVGNYSKEEKNSFYKYVLEHTAELKYLPEDIKRMIFESPLYTISMVAVKNAVFNINDFEGKVLSDNEVDIIKRFARVFDQAYTRFLDLQKAEAQAREAKIEAALERTRTQSMIMQHSKELDDTLRVFHQQVLLLGINSEFSYLWLPDEEKDQHIFWATWAEQQNNSTIFKSKALNYPLDRNEPATTKCIVDWKSDEPVHSYALPPGEVENYFATWAALLDGVEKLKPEHFPGGLYYVEAYMKYGCFGVMIEKELSEDKKKILGRFAIEFERAYTRFLDLQKAETQAREAKIEMALEKVRSRTMAMQHSNELPEAANVLFLEVQALGIPAWSCGYNVLAEDKKTSDCWMSSEGAIQDPFNLYFTEEASFLEWYNFLQSDESFFLQELGGKALEAHYNYMRTIPKLGNVIKKLEDAGISLPTYQINHLCKFTYGFLLFITYEPVPDAHDLFKRFTKVFEQTYTRFLDLKNAEAQAREAQIEAALERVRSRTMAMQRSDELAETAAILFQQFKGLGENPIQITIGVMNEEKKQIELQVTDWQGSGEKINHSFNVSIEEPTVGQKMYAGWKAQKKSTVVDLSGKELKAWVKYRNAISGVTDTNINLHKRRVISFGFYSKGLISISTQEICTPETIQLLERFAGVFDSTYTRFLDLQKAEAQAREAKIEYALEKVRSRTMAMQKSEELHETSQILFQQMKELGEPVEQL
ncbi:MAG: hypothetical protein M3Q56_13465, partial [Bacteroidota bacterium]|nr:hypothetical protein [Bacteroidota bacterium]